MRPNIVLVLLHVLLLASPALADEKVVLRAANGRFARADKDGTIRAEAWVPGESESFELTYRGKEGIALKGPGGRFLVADARDGRTPRLLTTSVQAGDAATLQVVPAGAGRFGLRPRGSPHALVFDSTAAQAPAGRTAAGVTAREMVEVFRVRELPAVLQTAIPAAVQALAAKELAGKQYDKTRSHKIEKHVELPAPTLQDPNRTKKVQVLGLTEEYRVQAQLDGEADIRLPGLRFLVRLDGAEEPAGGATEGKPATQATGTKPAVLLASWKLAPRGGSGVILVAVEARLPVRGHVQGKVENVASASTGYRATMELSAVAQVRVQREGRDITLSAPEVLDLHVAVSQLRTSNDLLDAMRRQIERLVNRELRHNEPKIREKANASLQKAFSSREVRVPLLGYLGVL
jgi:hypothetical protein